GRRDGGPGARGSRCDHALPCLRPEAPLMSIPRTRLVVLGLLFLLAGAPVLEVAARPGDADPVASGEQSERDAVSSAAQAAPAPYPTLAGARDALLAQHDQTVRAFDDALAAHNATYGQLAPTTSTDAFYDPVRPGARVGGI